MNNLPLKLQSTTIPTLAGIPEILDMFSYLYEKDKVIIYWDSQYQSVVISEDFEVLITGDKGTSAELKNIFNGKPSAEYLDVDSLYFFPNERVMQWFNVANKCELP